MKAAKTTGSRVVKVQENNEDDDGGLNVCPPIASLVL